MKRRKPRAEVHGMDDANILLARLVRAVERLEQIAYPNVEVPLKAKYRVDRDAHQQWGTGGDHTGKAKIQGKAKPQVVRNMVAVYTNGKRRMVEV